jgi:ribulose-5-phosphate 4-epimerase/fuculose-1-phosphate aldolase
MRYNRDINKNSSSQKVNTIMASLELTQQIQETRAAIAYVTALMFDRQLLDLGGGNISVRVDDQVCITPSYSGLRHHWALTADDVMVIDLEGQILAGSGALSRESKVHLRLHREFTEWGKAVIHCHARNIMVFAAANEPIWPIMEATRKFGVVDVINFSPAHSGDLSVNVADGIRGQEQRIQKHAAAVIAPYHGLFLMGKDLDLAADAVERIDTNAYCILNSGGLYSGRQQHEAMEAQMAKAQS